MENPLAKHWKVSEARGCCLAGSSGKQTQKKRENQLGTPSKSTVSGRGGGSLAPPKNQRPELLTEMLSAKAAFTKTCTSAALRASFFGPEHVFFEAAKSIVGKKDVFRKGC